MAREVAITIYLSFFSLVFKICKWFPLKNKVVFVVSFSENNKSVYHEIRRQEFSCRTIFLTSKKVYPSFLKFKEATVLLFEFKHLGQFLKSIYHLATAKVVLIDNYYGFLASIEFKDTAQCIQLWHAVGAIKKFGLQDPSIQNRSERAINRFNKVYQSFDKVVVGSEAMAEIFKDAFNINDSKLLRTGIPRTDIFYNGNLQISISEKLYHKYPFLKDKKIILYAPTFRDNNLNSFNLELELSLLKQNLEKDYILLLKLHPAIRNKLSFPKEYNSFVYDFSYYRNMNELLFITDILITDYSSIPFEYSLLGKPMIFFWYDIDYYQEARGFWEDYTTLIPGPIVSSTNEIVQLIKDQNFDIRSIKQFSQKWSQYSTGDSSYKIVKIIKDALGE
jgi:teichoic acid glycerol-phosphate primase